MTAQHTPGPWVAYPSPFPGATYVPVRSKRPGARFRIATVLCPVIPGRPVIDRELAETQANARLIAAAPDLIAFAHRIAQCEIPEAEDYAAEARALIAKVGGGAS